MNLGDAITLAGREWIVRELTAAEHQAWDEIRERHELDTMQAKLKAEFGAKAEAGVSMKPRVELLLEAKLASIDERLTQHLKRKRATRAQDEQAFQLASEADVYREQLERHRAERLARSILARNEYQAALEAAQAELAHQLLTNDGLEPSAAPELFGTRMSVEDHQALAAALEVAHVPLPLSAFTRQLNALSKPIVEAELRRMFPQLVSAGTASESSPPPPASPQPSGSPSLSVTSGGPSRDTGSEPSTS